MFLFTEKKKVLPVQVGLHLLQECGQKMTASNRPGRPRPFGVRHVSLIRRGAVSIDAVLFMRQKKSPATSDDKGNNIAKDYSTPQIALC